MLNSDSGDREYPCWGHESRLDVLEAWRAEHERWAGEKATMLTRVEMRQEAFEEWRVEMKAAALQASKNARTMWMFGVAELVALAGIGVAMFARH